MTDSLLPLDPALPVDAALPALRAALHAPGVAVLQAPPGSGKTTRVPLALLEEPWLAGRRIVLLEPRRLAARAAARWMARQLNEPVGETVGYRIRHDTRVGPTTRVEVVTEGVLARMLQHDPTLEAVGLVIFDEFHERSLHADLGLALALHSRRLVRDDLRLLVMSATLDGEPVARLLDGAPLVTAEGRTFPVETRYRPPREDTLLERAMTAAIHAALDEHAGDVLVFLPGGREIRRVAAALDDGLLDGAVDVVPLYGDLPQAEQDRAIRPSPAGRRKVVLATAIAQTSLTIEGVRVVIDSGLARGPRFSVRTGMPRLETRRVSRAAAEQRRGRAGRLGPGVCYRLWAAAAEARFRPFDPPEILEADLAPLALELADAGITDPQVLRWLDPPPAPALAQARALLRALDALDAHDRITEHGRRMLGLGVHPRLAHMLLRGAALGLGALACDLAALLGERDPLRGDPRAADADIRLRLAALRRGDGAERGLRHRLRSEARLLRDRLGVADAPARAEDDAAAGLLLAFAYPDRIAQRRPGRPGHFLLRGGQGAALAAPQPLGTADYLVAAELDGRRPESRIFLAAPLTLEALEAHFADQIELEEAIEWDTGTDAVIARRRERLGAIVLAEAPLRHPDPDAIAAALLARIARVGIDRLPWTDGARRLRARLAFLHRLDPSWPDVSDAALAAALPRWLGPRLAGLRRWAELERIDLGEALLDLLTWDQRAALDRLAPTHVTVPSGSRVRIDYTDPEMPALAVRLQEVFGLQETPTVGGGRVPLTLHLLSPAHRPVQVTRDLAGFWRGTYFDVRKDLKGRYPKHHWPDDPLRAEPTRRRRS